MNLKTHIRSHTNVSLSSICSRPLDNSLIPPIREKLTNFRLTNSPARFHNMRNYSDEYSRIKKLNTDSRNYEKSNAGKSRAQNAFFKIYCMPKLKTEPKFIKINNKNYPRSNDRSQENRRVCSNYKYNFPTERNLSRLNLEEINK